MNLLLENISYDDLKKYLKEFYNYAKKELVLDRPPRLFLKEDQENANDLLGKTGYYDPQKEEIHLFITDRHGKDIIRSFSHELVHHCQKLHGMNDNIDLSATKDPAYASKNPQLREMERDAFERGNMIFRDWTDMKKSEKNKMLNEKKSKGKKPKTFAGKVKRVQQKNPDLSKSSAERIIGAQVAGEKKNETKKPLTIKEKAKLQAKEHVKAALGRGDYMKEESPQEIKEELKQEQNKNPYPQLFTEKERLLKDAFNKREDVIYQELIRRFIKK